MSRTQPKPIEIGDRFGRWTVLAKAPRRGRHIYWLVRCDCGTENTVDSQHLRSGASQSCGCLPRKGVHGMTDHPWYLRWNSMRNRCNNPTNRDYHLYGGRGIKVCPQWDDFPTYVRDVEALGPPPSPEHTTIDRIDNDGIYEPGNIRWATQKEQRANQRRSKLSVV